MNLNQDDQNGAHIISVEGRLDGSTYQELEKTLFDAIETGHQNLVLDLSGLHYISSVGLRVLLLGAKKLKPAGGTLMLAGMTPEVQEVFEISGFLTLFPTAASREEAVASLGG